MVPFAVFLLFLINVNVIGGNNIMFNTSTEQISYEKEIDLKAYGSENTIHAATNSDEGNPTVRIISGKQMAVLMETVPQDGSAVQDTIAQQDPRMNTRETDPRLGPIRWSDPSDQLRQDPGKTRRPSTCTPKTRSTRRTRSRCTRKPGAKPDKTCGNRTRTPTAIPGKTRWYRTRTPTTMPGSTRWYRTRTPTAMPGVSTRRRRTRTTPTTPFTVKYLDDETTTKPWIWTTSEDSLQALLAKKLPFANPAPDQIGDLPKGPMFPVTQPLWVFEDYDDKSSRSKVEIEDYQHCESQMVRCTGDTDYNQPVCVVDLTMNEDDFPLYVRSKGFHSQCEVEYRNCLKRYEITGKYYADSYQEDYLQFLHYGWCNTCKLFGDKFCVPRNT